MTPARHLLVAFSTSRKPLAPSPLSTSVLNQWCLPIRWVPLCIHTDSAYIHTTHVHIQNNEINSLKELYKENTFWSKYLTHIKVFNTLNIKTTALNKHPVYFLVLISPSSPQQYCICFGYNPGFCDIGMNFNRLDHGNINGNCGNDYLAVGAEKLCGDFGPLTFQGTVVMFVGQLALCQMIELIYVPFNRVRAFIVLQTRKASLQFWPALEAITFCH